ncbi:MAG TPA: homocysteine S-methyltransferase family protein, partial [Anaeromyxobacteraceae bacterium]|nr:homocysteine S-methyltransferase family protein [Anaeromyxobacteraceae bacterium]
MSRPLDLAGPPLLLDGAMGTALLARGLPPGALPEDWLLERPGDVEAVHAGHAAAGARVLLSCTFNAASARLDGHPAGADLDRTCALAVALARRAAGGALV